MHYKGSLNTATASYCSDKMSLSIKVFHFGCNNTRLLSSTTGYTRTGGGTAGGAQNKQTWENTWGSMKTANPVKEDNKQLARAGLSRKKE